MFNILEVDAFYHEFMQAQGEPECVYGVAKLCEQWLLGFAGQESPHEAARLALGSSNGDSGRRLMFALSAALCAPSEATGKIIEAYQGYIDENYWQVQQWTGRLCDKIQPHHPVDILVAIDSLASTDLYETTRSLYDVSMTDIRWDACAWDNLKVFQGTLPKTGNEMAIFRALAMFTVDTTAAIHQAFVKTEEDEINLFRYRLERIRTQLGTVYNNGYASSREFGEKRPTLCSEMICLIGKPAMSDTVPIHKERGFSDSLKRDLEHCIQQFFENRGEGLYIATENWTYVDEITQAFLDAGVSPEMILAHGAWKTDTGAHNRPLGSALNHFGQMDANNQRFYACLFKAYLAKFEVSEIIRDCNSPEALAAVYQVTGDKAFLQAGGDKVREKVMGADLGL